MPTSVSIDGRLVPPDQAVVPVTDRGFLYGDSVFEILRTYGGRPHAVEAHLARLCAGAQALGIPSPPPDTLAAELSAAVQAAGNEESHVRLVLTRGDGDGGPDPTGAREGRRVIVVRPLAPRPVALDVEGLCVHLVPAARARRSPVDPAWKAGNYLGSVLALGDARRHGADEALFLDEDGAIREGATSNLLLVLDGALVTPPAAAGLLAGITRQALLALAPSLGLPSRERTVDVRALDAADEVLVCSTVRELVAVTRRAGPDGVTPLGGGCVGPWARRLRAAYRAEAHRALGLPPPDER